MNRPTILDMLLALARANAAWLFLTFLSAVSYSQIWLCIMRSKLVLLFDLLFFFNLHFCQQFKDILNISLRNTLQVKIVSLLCCGGLVFLSFWRFSLGGGNGPTWLGMKMYK